MNSNSASINGAMMWVVFMCGVQRKAKAIVCEFQLVEMNC